MPERLVEGGAYIRLSGTSMAAPVVSGVAALMFQKHPEWTNDAVKWIMLNNALQIKETVNGVGVPIKGQGAGVVNATSSVNFTGTPGLANKGIPISEQLVGPNGATTYQTSTWSRSTWSTSTWSTSTWSTSTWSTSTWSTSNWSTNVNLSNAPVD